MEVDGNGAVVVQGVGVGARTLPPPTNNVQRGIGRGQVVRARGRGGVPQRLQPNAKRGPGSKKPPLPLPPTLTNGRKPHQHTHPQLLPGAEFEPDEFDDLNAAEDDDEGYEDPEPNDDEEGEDVEGEGEDDGLYEDEDPDASDEEEEPSEDEDDETHQHVHHHPHPHGHGHGHPHPPGNIPPGTRPNPNSVLTARRGGGPPQQPRMPPQMAARRPNQPAPNGLGIGAPGSIGGGLFNLGSSLTVTGGFHLSFRLWLATLEREKARFLNSI